MDPTNEFTFKPLTEGLGFHKKKKDFSKGEEKAFKKDIVPVLNKSKEMSSKNKSEIGALRSPLPKKEMMSASASASSSLTMESPSKEVIDELVRNFKKSKEVEDLAAPKTPQVIINPVQPQIDEEAFPLPWMMSPFLIDTMLVMALILSALMAVLLVTKIDLLMVLVQNSSDIGLWLTLPAIGAVMTFAYMSLSRIFLGNSLGELIFDIQLGTTEQQGRLSYSFLVIARVFLVMVTGFILIPLLSLAFRKDYLGQWCGLQLYRRKK